MPRPQKAGIDYSGWDVDIFDGDRKIDKLLDGQGWRGFGIYFYLCQRAYGTNGYFYEWGFDDCPTTARRLGGGVVSQTVEETVNLCLQVGLFDKELFDRWGVLTSRGIQKRYWAVAQDRRVRTVYSEYWLLLPEEARGAVKVARFPGLSPANADLSPANADLSPANEAHKVKESKVKKYTVPFSGEKDTDTSPEKLFEIFWKAYPRKDNKKTARQKFLTVLREKRGTFDEIMAGLERDKRSDQWTKDNGKFIPMPTTWINQDRWNNQGIDKDAMGKPVNSVEDDYELVETESGEKLWQKKKRT